MTPPEKQAPPRQGRITLLLGGARSGKSSYAEHLAAARAQGAPVLYLATATAGDDEMRARITAHRAARPAHWLTVEAANAPAEALAGVDPVPRVVLLDCVTLLVSNILLQHTGSGEANAASEARAQHDASGAVDALLAWQRATSAELIIVSNEVGMGIVPAYPLGRAYRDMLGRINARLASQADAVLLMVAGLPIELKSLAAAWQVQQEREQE